MGHNRGWEEAASMFTGASIELKTCNAALLEATGKSWEEVTFPFFIKYFLSCCLSVIFALFLMEVLYIKYNLYKLSNMPSPTA